MGTQVNINEYNELMTIIDICIATCPFLQKHRYSATEVDIDNINISMQVVMCNR